MNVVAALTAVMVPSPSASVDSDAADVLPELWVPEAWQWLSTSAGRVAPDGYSWMQGVHWVAGSGLYQPRRHRSHGPRSFGPTTVFIAQLLAELSPCRPGIDYLMRRTGLTKRAVQNHLQILRETGLLAYIVKGTRQRGGPPQASEFALMLPPEFDAALGIRTSGEGTGRRMTGIAKSGRKLMARLAEKASRKVRRPRSATSSRAAAKGARKRSSKASVVTFSVESRCTPMGGGSSVGSSAGGTSFPPESKLASGQRKSPTPKKPRDRTGGRRKLNYVGRRFQLAGELICRVPWLGKAARPRIAWIVREVADAGWTADEVIAWLDLEGAPERVLRPSGFLAQRLDGAVRLWPTPEGRACAVEAYRASRRAEQARHTEWEGSGGPSSQSVARLLREAQARVREHDQPPAQLLYTLTTDDVPAAPPELSEYELIDMRAAAQKDPDLVTSIVAAYGQEYARRVFTADIADLVQRARGTGHLIIDRPWEEYA